MHRPRIIAALAVGTTVLAGAAAVSGTATAAAAHPDTMAIAHSRPSWVGSARSLGPARQAAVVHSRVYLQPKHGLDALKSFVDSVSTPGSAQYHHFLTATQYRARFGTTKASARQVASYLRAHGLTVTGTAAYNRYLTVRGTVAEAESAFGTQLATYRHQGRVVRAPSAAVRIPSTVASSVLAVTGLDTSPNKARTMHSKPEAVPAGFRNAHPCSIYYGQVKSTYQADFKTALPKFQGSHIPYAPCGYTGPQFRAAYEGNTTLDGSGVTVGIIDAYASPTIVKDANTYAENNGDGSYAPGQYVQTQPTAYTHKKACGPTGWYGEETLDVEAVHAMAPGAKIHFYAGASCYDNDLLDAQAQVVNQDKVQIVSNSYGDLGEGVSADQVNANEAVFMQGAAEGISFLFSSGDDGDDLAATGIKQVDYSASDPYVTAVGGTATAIGASGNLEWQTGWGTDKYSLSSDQKSWTPVGYLYGAGGGSSALFNRPSYQDGVTNSPYRQVPDVAMDADPTTGMLVGETQQFPDGRAYGQYRIGGTSLASPLFAGMTALSLQAGGGESAGFLNPLIYGDQSAFTDVKGKPKDPGNVRVDYVNGVDGSDGLVYSVRTFDQDASLKVTKGYDQVTGVGVPNAGWLNVLS